MGPVMKEMKIGMGWWGVRFINARNKRVVQSDEGILWWFRLMERMENAKMAKRLYVGDSASSYSVGRLRKRWIDTMKEC